MLPPLPNLWAHAYQVQSYFRKVAIGFTDRAKINGELERLRASRCAKINAGLERPWASRCAKINAGLERPRVTLSDCCQRRDADNTPGTSRTSASVRLSSSSPRTSSVNAIRAWRFFDNVLT